MTTTTTMGTCPGRSWTTRCVFACHAISLTDPCIHPPTHPPPRQERERRRKIRKQVAESKAVASRQAAGATGLFALLPKPKAEEALDQMLSKSSSNAAAAKKKAAAAEEESKKAAKVIAVPAKQEEDDSGNDSSDDDDDAEGAGLLHPSLMAGAKAAALPRVSMINIAPSVSSGGGAAPPSTSASSYKSSLLAAQAPVDAPLQQQEYYPQQQATAGAAQEGGGDYDAQWQAYYAAQAQAQAQAQQKQQQQHQPPPAPLDDETLDEFGMPLHGAQSRKQKQRLQRELAAGNLDAVNHLGSVANVARSDETWDPFRNGPPQKKEKVAIAAALYDTKTGETVTTTNVSRTHRGKHHINALAVQAAEREAALLEGKARSMQSKAQTQGKYGW